MEKKEINIEKPWLTELIKKYEYYLSYTVYASIWHLDEKRKVTLLKDFYTVFEYEPPLVCRKKAFDYAAQLFQDANTDGKLFDGHIDTVSEVDLKEGRNTIEFDVCIYCINYRKNDKVAISEGQFGKFESGDDFEVEEKWLREIGLCVENEKIPEIEISYKVLLTRFREGSIVRRGTICSQFSKPDPTEARNEAIALVKGWESRFENESILEIFNRWKYTENALRLAANRDVYTIILFCIAKDKTGQEEKIIYESTLDNSDKFRGGFNDFNKSWELNQYILLGLSEILNTGQGWGYTDLGKSYYLLTTCTIDGNIVKLNELLYDEEDY